MKAMNRKFLIVLIIIVVFNVTFQAVVSGKKLFRRKRQLLYGIELSSCPHLEGPELGWMNCTQYGSFMECMAGCFPGHAFRSDERETMTLGCRDGIWRPQAFFPSCRSLQLCELEYPGRSSFNCTLMAGGREASCDITCNGFYEGRYECYQQWRPPLPRCVKANPMWCAEPEIVGGSFYNCTVDMGGTLCDIICDGFNEGRYHCYPGKRWSPTLPRCVRDAAMSDYCEEPEVPENGRVLFRNETHRQTSVGSELRYVCVEGYKMEGADRISCLLNGQWSSPPPRCHLQAPPADIVQKECGDPGPISNGRFLTPNGHRDPSYPEGARLKYSCEVPYVLRGNETIICESTELWSTNPPTCVEDCGRSFVQARQRIHHGNETKPGEWPWTVAISTQNGSLKCSGLLINRRTVLTAAHCLATQDQYVLRFGKFYLRNSRDDEQVLNSSSTRIILHPSYNKTSYVSDIALIKFYPSIRRYTSRIQPICLPTRSTTTMNLQLHKSGYVTGWGQTETDLQPDELLVAYLPVQSREKCKDSYDKQIMTGMFCAGFDRGTVSKDKTASACTGDSGSGLVFYDAHQRYTVEGIVSFGIAGECGIPKRYTVFTKVSEYIDWIQENVK